MADLHTIDIDFDNEENLNKSVEGVKQLLEKLKTEKKLSSYYLMRYINTKERFLGIKIIFNDTNKKEETLEEIKKETGDVKGCNGLRQDQDNGVINDNLPFLCSESMEFRNKVWNILGRKPTDEEFLYLIHYLSNPLQLSNQDELRIYKRRINQLGGQS